MLKKIDISEARLGMYVGKLGGSWLDHPFWRSAFRIDTPGQLQELREYGIRELWIDTEKGVDVGPDVPAAPSGEEACEPGDAAAASEEAAASQEAGAPSRLAPAVPFHEEIERARKLHKKAHAAVMHIFHEVRMGKVLEAKETFALVDEITQAMARNSDAFLSLLRLKEKDNHTYLHSLAVCALMIAVGRQFGIEGQELRNLGVAGLLHDIGMIKEPHWLLTKPEPLSEQEYEAIRMHPKIGWVILSDAPEMNEMALDVCLHHHERMDGEGYPDKLPGERLSLYSRICAVCDTYDTLTSDRCYAKALTPADAIREMAASRIGHFDEKVFQAFVKAIGIYPVGTLVRLKSERLAVVTEQAARSLLTPKVKVIFSTKLDMPVTQASLDLSKSRDSIVGVEDPKKWRLDLKQIVGIG